MPAFIPPALQVPIALICVLVALIWVLNLWAHHLRHNHTRRVLGSPTKTALQHVATHPVHHLSAAVVAGAGIAVLFGVGVTVALLYHGGLVFNHARHITPKSHSVPVAGAAPYVSPDLFALAGMIPDVVDQGNTNSCCGQSMVEIDALNRALLYGEHVPQDAPPPNSGFKLWYYASGGRNVGTTVDGERDALNRYGLEPLRYWPLGGSPDATDALHTLYGPGATTTYQFYIDGGGGAKGLSTIQWILDQKRPVGLIWKVPNTAFSPQADGFLRPGGGPTVFYHCLIAVRWTSNYLGHGPAIEVWNSWGIRWGLGGFAWMGAADVESQIDGAWTENPGARIAAFATRAKSPTAVPPPPSKTPAPPTVRPPAHTKTPVAPKKPLFRGVYVVTTATNLRIRPAKGAKIVAGLAPQTRLRSLGKETAHWAEITFHARIWYTGWVAKMRVRPVRR